MSRTFIVFILTQIFSLIGSRMTGVAIGIKVFEETGNTSPLLIAAFFAELPLMVAGSFTGILADKLDKRLVIVLGDVGQAAGTLLLLISFTSGAFQLWHLYVVMFVQGIFGAIQSPASEAAIAVLVPEGHRDRANGIRQIGFPLAGVVAPALAGLVYGLAGLAAVIGIDFITFMVAVIVVLRLSIPRAEPSTKSSDHNGSFWKELLGGWAFLIQRRALLWLTLYIAFVFFLINGPLEMIIPYSLLLVKDETITGIIMAAASGGAFAGGIAITLIGNIDRRIRVILTGYLLHGVFLVAYGMVRSPVLLGISAFLMMFPLSFNGALFSTFLQNKTPPDMQGRVFAITGQIFTLTTPLSFLIAAFLADNMFEPAVGKPGWEMVAPIVGSVEGSGIGLILVGVGLVIVAATLAIWAVRRVRTLENDLPNYATTVS